MYMKNAATLWLRPAYFKRILTLRADNSVLSWVQVRSGLFFIHVRLIKVILRSIFVRSFRRCRILSISSINVTWKNEHLSPILKPLTTVLSAQSVKATTSGPHQFYLHCQIFPCRSILVACSKGKVFCYATSNQYRSTRGNLTMHVKLMKTQGAGLKSKSTLTSKEFPISLVFIYHIFSGK